MNLLAQTDRLFSKAEKRAIKYRTYYECQNIELKSTLKEDIQKEWNIEITRLKEDIIPRYFELKQILEEGKIINRDNTEKLPERYVFITLRPEENVCNLKTFIYHTETFFKKNLFNDSVWAFEQCGKTNEDCGKGFHAHGIAKVKNYVQVKDIIKAYEFIPYNCILQIGRKDSKCKFITKPIDLEYANNYIRGEKHNEEKNKSVIIDKIWREKNNLKDLYD